MKWKLTILTLLMCMGLRSQDLAQDLDLIKTHTLNGEAFSEPNETRKFKGLLKLYSTHISEQIINDCIYSPSCSEFSQGAIDEFGLFKGVFLTTDRLMRCNRLSQDNVMPVRFDDFGKITDHWISYGKKK